MIRGAIYFDTNSPVIGVNDSSPFIGAKYELIDGSNIPNDGSTPVGDDSSYSPAATDTIILTPRGNINCWAEWDSSNTRWRFIVSDTSYVGYVFYTIHQAS